MMGMALAVALLQSPSPAPAATLSPEWIAVPLKPLEYARYSRKTAGGEVDISAARQVCDCQPKDVLTEIDAALAKVPSITYARDQIQVCGVLGERNITAGIEKLSPTTRNLETIAFRRNSALYTMNYAFRTPLPDPKDEAALMTLCGTDSGI